VALLVKDAAIQVWIWKDGAWKFLFEEIDEPSVLRRNAAEYIGAKAPPYFWLRGWTWLHGARRWQRTRDANNYGGA
jgi:hypothetical protein